MCLGCCLLSTTIVKSKPSASLSVQLVMMLPGNRLTSGESLQPACPYLALDKLERRKQWQELKAENGYFTFFTSFVTVIAHQFNAPVERAPSSDLFEATVRTVQRQRTELSIVPPVRGNICALN